MVKTNQNEAQDKQNNDGVATETVLKLNSEETGLVLAGMGIQSDADIMLNSVVPYIMQGKHLSKQAAIAEIRGVDAGIRSAYDKLKKKVDVKIKEHLKEMDVAYDQNQMLYMPEGSLKYIGNPFYIKEVHGDGGVPISPSMDKSLGYEFFMFRLITGGKEYPSVEPYRLKDTHIVTFNKNDTKEYSKVDVLKLFTYYNKVEIEALNGDIPNKEVFNILKKDKEAVVNSVTEVFKQYKTQCNVLKDIDASYKDQIVLSICATKYEPEDQDYYIQYATCREVFNMAALDEFCKKQEVVIPDYFDEL